MRRDFVRMFDEEYNKLLPHDQLCVDHYCLQRFEALIADKRPQSHKPQGSTQPTTYTSNGYDPGEMIDPYYKE